MKDRALLGVRVEGSVCRFAGLVLKHSGADKGNHQGGTRKQMSHLSEAQIWDGVEEAWDALCVRP